MTAQEFIEGTFTPALVQKIREKGCTQEGLRRDIELVQTEFVGLLTARGREIVLSDTQKNWMAESIWSAADGEFLGCVSSGKRYTFRIEILLIATYINSLATWEGESPNAK